MNRVQKKLDDSKSVDLKKKISQLQQQEDDAQTKLRTIQADRAKAIRELDKLEQRI
jgi:hypothetical protein